MSNTKHARILVIDDDEELVLLFKRMMEKDGYEVSHAPTGSLGLEMLKNEEYHLLVLDYVIPGMDGLEVLRCAAANGPVPPTVIITGVNNSNVTTAALEPGANHHRAKDKDEQYIELIPSIVKHTLAGKLPQYGKEYTKSEDLRPNDEIGSHINQCAELQNSEELFSNVFLSATDCIFTKDLSLKYTSANPQTVNLLGISETGIVGKTDRFFFKEATATHLEEVDTRVILGETVEEEHTRAVNGCSYTFLDTRIPIRDRSGTVRGILGISRNITDRKRMPQIRTIHADEYPSNVMRSTMEAAGLAAQSDSIVLLNGERGVGKEAIAKYIHDNSPRGACPFLTVNCTALSPDFTESELFGHESGAYSCASRMKKGLFELGEGGTVMLNGVADLSLSLQSKLLEFVDTRSFTRIGGQQSRTANVRLIAATCKDLKSLVDAGTFREDFFYRINVLSIRIPSLSERPDDIPILVKRLLRELYDEMQIPDAAIIPSDVMEALCRYSWPGNIRELRNVLERALILAQGAPLSLEVFGLDQIGIDEWTWSAQFPPSESMNEELRKLKIAFIKEALHRAGGKRTEAAGMLSMSRDALKKHMKTLGLMPKRKSW